MTLIIIKFYLIFTLLFGGYAKKHIALDSKTDSPAVLSNDDLRITEVIPGVKHYEYKKSEYPWIINVLEVDLKQKNLFFEAVKSNDKMFSGREKTSTMVNRKTDENFNVIGAINADFFNMDNGNIDNIQITNGKFVRGINTRKSLIAITYNNTPYIDKYKFFGKLIFKDSNSIDIKAVNYRRGKDSVVLYNSYWGSSTLTKGTGKEFILQSLEEWKVNEPVKVLLTSSNDSNTTITDNNVILSGDGIMSRAISEKTNIGDTLLIVLGVAPKIEKIKEVLGGLPQIVKNGEDISEFQTIKEGSSNKFVTTRHPRTAVGYNKDKTKLYLLVVDGRQSKSVGMSLPELSKFMISIGCFDALNLDGGGSTTMLVKDKIVNSPSDLLGERTVGNALLLFSR